MRVTPQRRNANRHTPRGMQALERSLEQDGWIGAITVAADGETFDGSARVEKTAENGMLDDPIIVDSDGTRPVVVRRVDIASADDPRAKRLGIAANRVASLNLEWEPDVLASLAGEIDLSSMFSPDELADLAAPQEPAADPPVAVDETQPTRCQPGDVWRVGAHTLACLDSTDAANVARVLAGRTVAMVWADPPYGIGFDPMKNRDQLARSIPRPPVIGDETTETARAAARLCIAEYSDAVQVWWGANNYADALPPSSCWIVWDKENTGDFADVELAWTNIDGAARLFRHMWNGMLKASERGETRIHPTQKPIALAEWAFDKYGAPGDLILDPFLGSGPSVKAAQRTGRVVVGFELAPAYIDHLLEWGEAEGLTVELQS